MVNTHSDSLESINKKAARRYEAHKKRLRERYRYARNMGFSVVQAQVLCSFSEEHIDRLANERDAIE